jgi:hypothetical protein
VKEDPQEKEDLFKKEGDRAKKMVARYKKLSATIKNVKAEGGPIKEF